MSILLKKFGYLTVIAILPCRKTKSMVLCRCDCGVEKPYYRERVKSGRIVSCGCKRSRVGRTHGGCRGKKLSRVYRTWASMISRCTNARHKSYGSYGGRGIKVCDRWQGANGFPNFFADMGEPLPDLSIDRIDNDGDYEPVNCRWATRSQQQRNKRPCKRK